MGTASAVLFYECKWCKNQTNYCSVICVVNCICLLFNVCRFENGASAKDGEGAGRGPCGLRNSELGPRPHNVLFLIIDL